MHEIAATIGSSSIILIGLIFGILYNQRSVDRSEKNLNDRMDRMEKHVEARVEHLETHFDARITRFESHVDQRFDRMRYDLAGFHRSLGQHDKAIEVLEKRAT